MPGKSLESWNVDVPDPVPGEVLLRTVIGGVCGTDAHRLAGDLPAAGTPIAFGHEGIGRIEALGEGRSTDSSGAPVTVGDLVYWTPSGARPGQPPAMGWPPSAAVPSPASYQDYATLAATNVFYRIPEDTAPEAVIAFGCAMPTALGGYARLGGIAAGHTVVIQGSGPVGLASTFLAAVSPARQVIVIGAPANRLEAAARLGATKTVLLDDTTVDERLALVHDLTEGRGADVVIEATGRAEAFPEGTGLLAEGGRYLILGIYSGQGTVPLDVVRLNNLNQAVVGSMGPASFDDCRTTILFAQRYGDRLGFADLVTHRFALSQTEQAIASARSGQAIKAIVLPELD
jgi:5-exo-hydroxycamphor dehydrogenase